jgi:tRNA U34 5-carboxymethylaminomethyl modifying enzyme MnmG/GidA
MKSRITITLDPTVVRQAKNVARERHTNLSALIEDLLKQTAQSNVAPRRSFTQKWAGKLTVREDNKDELLKALKTRYGLEQ